MSEKTKFDDYRGGALAAAGFTRVGSTNFPLMQSYDIQAGEDDKRLNTVIDDIWTAINNIRSPLPREIYTEKEMTSILDNATSGSVGSIYKYMGTQSKIYTKGELYIIEEE